MTYPKLAVQPYVSLDLETTGTDEDVCQILEIGAIFDYLDRPIAECPKFHRYVRHKVYVGQAFAFNLNHKIMGRLAEEPETFQYCCADDVSFLFRDWIQEACKWNMKDESLLFAGKNFAGFDLQFLKNLPLFKENVRWKHRILEPSMLYMDPMQDATPPSTETCLARAGLQRQVAHEALADAEAVCKLLRFKWGVPY